MYCRVDHRERRKSPWIAGRSESARITDVPQREDKLDIGYGEAARSVHEVCKSAGWCCEKERGYKNGDLGKGFLSREKDTALSQQTSLLQEKGEGV